MKQFSRTIWVFLVLLLPQLVKSQEKAPMDSMLTGRWEGTSICQIRNSPCHDEVVVYYISKTDSAGHYRVVANKIVNGKEEEMGVLNLIYSEKDQQLVSLEYNGDWRFKLHGKKLSGTLWYKGSLYRIIEVIKKG